MSTSAVILGVVLMAAGVVCLFLVNHQYWELHSEMNERLPEGQKLEPLLWTPVTYREFRQLRKRVLPDSRRPKRAFRFAIAGFCLFFGGLVILLMRANF